MRIRNIVLGCLAGCALISAGIAAIMLTKGYSLEEVIDRGGGYLAKKSARYSVTDRVKAIEQKKPQLMNAAETLGGKLRVLVFKQERMVELHAPGWQQPRKYPMTGFSGRLGPKLREGDCQIPEGIYGIEYLNPNSNYYLSLKVSYPNKSDRAHAKAEGRTKLGGDIMIHGKSVTIGCIPIGDDAIEDVFYLASAVGVKNITIIISPYDMRKGRNPELEKSALPWYGERCNEIAQALIGRFR